MSSNTRCSGLSRQRGQVAGRNYPPTNKNTLIRALTEEWDKLPQQLLDNVVQSIFQNHKSQLPPLSYIIALDIWLFVCIFMVFATLVEFAISYNSYVIKHVNFSRNSEPKEPSPEEKNHTRIRNPDQKDDNVSEHSSRLNKNNGWFCHLILRDVTKVDLVSRIFFPLTFSVFSIAYWTYYLMIYNTT
ncbi:hypothetical protein TNCV_4176431 [Trichonephila clavipes]|nr:hypothetical protein TNCV_4176431 [Trichonephila clavipes]